MADVVVAVKDPGMRRVLAALLGAHGLGVATPDSAEAAEAHLRTAAPVDVVLTDLWHAGARGTEWVNRLQGARPGARLLVLFHPTEHEAAVECLRAGATDALLAPGHPDEVLLRVRRALAAGGAAGSREEELQAALAEATAEVRRGQEARTALEATLLRHAAVDPLTGLSNRRVFEERLATEHFRARRFKRPLSLIVLDVDHANRLETRMGSAGFQQVLRQLSAYLREGLRETDVAARTDDDEFGLILPETPRAGARELAREIRRVLGSASWVEAGRVTVSGGVAELDGEVHREPAALWEAARAEQRRAKELGRDRVEG